MNEHYYEYRTGHTHPKKSRNGPVAFLLICVIFLAGIVSLLGLLNIHLFRQLQQTDFTSPISFSQGGTLPASADALSLSMAGMTLQELPSLYQKLYDLPEGLYVTHVSAGSSAEQRGIAPGNVLLFVDGVAVTQLDALQGILEKTSAPVTVTVYQNGSVNTLRLNP